MFGSNRALGICFVGVTVEDRGCIGSGTEGLIESMEVSRGAFLSNEFICDRSN